LEGMRQLAAVSMEDCTLPDKCRSVIGRLEDYRRRHPLIPDQRFQEAKAAAGELRGGRGLREWSSAWAECQETREAFDKKMEAALRTRDSAHSRSAASSRRTLSGLWGLRETSCPLEEDSTSSSPAPLLQRLLHSASVEEAHREEICSSSPSLLHSSSSSGRRQPLRKTQSFDGPHEAPRFMEPVRRGNTGVLIRGLEVGSSEGAPGPRTAAHGWAAAGPRSPESTWTTGAPGAPGTIGTPGGPPTDPRARGRWVMVFVSSSPSGHRVLWDVWCLRSKLRHLVEEMVTTERQYVRSLRYALQHYSPEMERPDLPQGLRGNRSVVFGNLEKLLDFHTQFFLRELEACWRHPLRVPHCFLRHVREREID